VSCSGEGFKRRIVIVSAMTICLMDKRFMNKIIIIIDVVVPDGLCDEGQRAASRSEAAQGSP
jgi:hypothetical protein